MTEPFFDDATGTLWADKLIDAFGSDASTAANAARSALDAAGFEYPADPCLIVACEAYAALNGVDTLLDVVAAGVPLEDILC